jgi:hypothetical protein
MNNPALERVSTGDVMFEQLAEISPEQAIRYNLLNSIKPGSKNKLKYRNPASRNIIRNMLGYKNTTYRQYTKPLKNANYDKIAFVSNPIRKNRATRSISPKAKTVGGKRKKVTRRRRSRHN